MDRSILSRSDLQLVDLFLKHFERGDICIHPTDTVLGISAFSRDDTHFEKIQRIKGRSAEKSFIRLVGSVDWACKILVPMPACFDELLEKIWPGPVTVVAPMRTNQMVTCALRVPKWPDRKMWMREVLLKVEEIDPLGMISTSCNVSAENVISDAGCLVDFIGRGARLGLGVFSPRFEDLLLDKEVVPSTLIRLDWDSDLRVRVLRKGGSFELLRPKLVSSEWITEEA